MVMMMVMVMVMAMAMVTGDGDGDGDDGIQSCLYLSVFILLQVVVSREMAGLGIPVFPY
jgi:hypothetical protein